MKLELIIQISKLHVSAIDFHKLCLPITEYLGELLSFVRLMASTTPKRDVFHLGHLQPGLGAEEPAAFHVIIYQSQLKLEYEPILLVLKHGLIHP